MSNILLWGLRMHLYSSMGFCFLLIIPSRIVLYLVGTCIIYYRCRSTSFSMAVHLAASFSNLLWLIERPNLIYILEIHSFTVPETSVQFGYVYMTRIKSFQLILSTPCTNVKRIVALHIHHLLLLLILNVLTI